MPEYLAPGVYVEEIDTGSKPIEGVSTSTAGMVGVTERGPVNVPILVTSYGEYVRWFGERLNKNDFLDHCYLPHAVEGFFTNGGERLYVARVLETAAAVPATAKLFDRNGATSAATSLLVGAGAGAPGIYVASGSGLGVPPPPTWIQIGDGSGSEYRTIVAAPAASDVELRLPLAFAYDQAGTNVDHFAPFGAAVGPQLDGATKPGDTTIHVSGPGAIAAGTIIRLGTTAIGDDEYVVASGAPSAAAPNPRAVPLATPVALSHPGGAGNNVDLFNPLTVPSADRTALTGAVAAGSSVLLLANPSPYHTAGDVVQISDGTHTEIRTIGGLNTLPLAVPAYADYPAGTIVEPLTFKEDLAKLLLTADAAAGTTVLELDSRDGLTAGDLIAIGALGDPQREYIVIKQLPSWQASPNAGKVILAAPLQIARAAKSEVHRTHDPARATPGPTAIAVATPRNAAGLTVAAGGYAATNIFHVALPSADYYHLLSGPAAALTAAPLTLDQPLTLPHAAGEPVVARTPLLTVEALDAGAWGDRLRIAAHDNDPPLAKSRIRAILDGTHLRLVSANGVEPGTILHRLDAGGAILETVKVKSLDRQNDFLITLEGATPLSGAAAVGDAVRSQEFQLDIFLMRQTDPAVPTRSETVSASESFPYLSLDPRHSRYVHKVIGTTWTLGSNADDDGNPLRKSDRRSEGTSWYVRVRDEEPDPAKRLAIRLGPEPLVDILPSGTRRPARLRLALGDDAVGLISDATYVGAPNIEPELRTGICCLENEEDVSIVACPGQISALTQGALIDHCEQMRYRFAVLDGPAPPNDSLNDVQSSRQQFDTKYAAFYHPWLVIPDPFPANLSNIAAYPIPPSGHMLGVYARTDIERGVHKAPANEVVRGITGLQRILNKSEHDILNPYPININVIRDFRNNSRGIRVYGGRVITSDPDWKYVNVRRLLIFIESSIDRGLQWVVFEPNAEPLWARVRRSIVNFLTLAWRNGALEGTKAEEAFFVKCDRTTMTQTDIDNGRLICVVGVAPVKPAEFVIIRIGLWTAHADD
jgi:phage tail sheath protein FI